MQCIERVSRYLESYGEVRTTVKKQFESLVDGDYIQRVGVLVSERVMSASGPVDGM